jgi:diguanylate cyclase (GGDEF)-like protein
MTQRDALAGRQLTLFQALEPSVRSLALLPPIEGAIATPAEAQTLAIMLQADSGAKLGELRIGFEGSSSDSVSARVAPAVECLRQEMAATDAAVRATELKLLRLANELDIDFAEDPQLEKALLTVARRAGADCAWLSAPRCGLTLRASVDALDPAVQREVDGLPARVAQLTGQLRRPLAINGPAGRRADRSAECRLLIVPMFLGRARHPAWLVLASALTAPMFGGWQMLPALSLANAISRQLEVELDRRTGMFNRGGLEAAMRRCVSTQGTLLLLDIDRLHAINQVHGLAAGDEAIMALSHLLAPPVLPQDALTARFTGGCFAIVLPNANATEAAQVAAHVQTAVEAIMPGGSADQSPLTISCGVVEVDNFRAPFDRFAVEGDFVLKLAKDRGRSRIEIHTSGNQSLIRRHDEVLAAADLREALRTNQIVLFAQRIQSLQDTAAPPGFELLIRMRDPSGEVRPPGDFIAAAQRYQLLPALDRYVVDQAFTALAPHRALLARLSASVSINISGQSIGEDAFIDYFIETLRNSRVPPGVIIVEVTEQAAVTNVALAEKTMRRLRDVGCGIALDDFGTGANSLVNLRSLPVTRIKIDGSFVHDMMTNPRSEAAVRGILQLSKGFKLDTVAEYVETEALAVKLRALGVDKGQGHLFGRPEPIETALRGLADLEFAELRGMLESQA